MLGQPQRELPCWLGMKIEESGEPIRQCVTFNIRAPLELRRELVGNIPKPALARVEGDHPNWIVVSTGVEVVQGRFAVALLSVSR